MNYKTAYFKYVLVCLNVSSMAGFGIVAPRRQTFGKVTELHMSTKPGELPYKIPFSEDDVRFPSFNAAFNQRWRADNLKAVYRPKTALEVAEALDDALENFEDGVKIRSGGHCYEDFVMNGGTKAIIDVQELLDWGYEEGKGWYLSTGDTNWGAFKKVFPMLGKVLPGGSCYSVGLGGHISGGGDGIMSRKYGTTVDWLTGIEIVVKDSDADAKVLYVGEDSEGDEYDLFWACKGAGNGNFGVITKYYFKELPDAPKGAIISNLAFRWSEMTVEKLQKVLDYYVAFAANDENRDSSAKFQIFHQAAGEAQMMIHTAYWNEQNRTAALEYHETLQKQLSGIFPISTCTMSLPGHMGYFSGQTNYADSDLGFVKDTITDYSFYDSTQTMNPSGATQRGKYKSAYYKKEFPPAQVQTIIEYLTKIPDGLDESDMRQSLLQVDCFAGAINDFDTKSAAIPQRSYVVKLQYQTYWGEEKNDAKHLGWIRDFYKEMYKTTHGFPDPRDDPDQYEGCYYNYPDVDLNLHPDGVDHALYLYFLDNYEKNDRNLVDVKRKWDPNNFFNSKQSIPVKPE